MKIIYHRRFNKQLAKLQKHEKLAVAEAIELFAEVPFDSRLRNHALSGRFFQEAIIDWLSRAFLLPEQLDLAFLLTGRHGILSVRSFPPSPDFVGFTHQRLPEMMWALICKSISKNP